MRLLVKIIILGWLIRSSPLLAQENSEQPRQLSAQLSGGANYYDAIGVYVGVQFNRQLGSRHSVTVSPSVDMRIVDVSKSPQFAALGDGSKLGFMSFGINLLYCYGYSSGQTSPYFIGGIYLGSFGYYDAGGKGYDRFYKGGRVDGVVGLGHTYRHVKAEARVLVPFVDPYFRPLNPPELKMHPTFYLLFGFDIAGL